MTQPNIPAGLKSLHRALRELKSLLAWADLVESERRPHTPPAFEIRRDIRQDIRTQYSYFLKTAMDLDHLFATGKAGGSPAQRQKWKKRLSRLKRQLQKLDLPTGL